MDNKGPIEVALSTDLRGKPHHFALWDVYTGTQIVVFKGSTSNVIPNCLQLIDNNFFITANENMLHIWSIFHRKCLDQKLFLPARPSTICMSPCGNYLSAGISEMIYVWQLHSGNLLANVQRHYQTVKVLKMNHEGTFLISGGEDGMVLVWPFADLISATHNTGALKLDKSRKDVGVNEPRYSWQHHNGQVTDIHISNGGLCVTSSTDMTINIYSYADGKRLYSVVLPSPIWSVTMNKNETKIFLGGQDGNIYEIATSSISISLVDSQTSESAIKPIFKGHKDKVISLIVSTDGSRLISASLDSSCKIWDTYQRKLLQDIKHQAPLANLNSLIVPNALALTSLTQTNSKAPISFRSLKRSLYHTPRDSNLVIEELFEPGATTIIMTRNRVDYWSAGEEEDCSFNNITNGKHDEVDIPEQATKVAKSAANNKDKTILELEQKVRQLYFIASKRLFKNAADESLKSLAPADFDENVVDNFKKRGGRKRPKKKKLADVPKAEDQSDNDDSDVVLFEEDVVVGQEPATVRAPKRLKSKV